MKTSFKKFVEQAESIMDEIIERENTIGGDTDEVDRNNNTIYCLEAVLFKEFKKSFKMQVPEGCTIRVKSRFIVGMGDACVDFILVDPEK